MEIVMKQKKKILYIIFAIIVYIIMSQRFNSAGNFDAVIQNLILIAALVVGGVFLFKKNLSNRFKIIMLLLAIALLISYPLYNDYLVWQHDMEFHIARIENIKEALSNGQVPVRIHPLDNNENGYGSSLMYPELFIYIPAILRLLNTTTIFSYKILLFLINFTAVASMYLCVKKISKSTTSGIIGAIVYGCANYRLETVFTRASIGEALALAFFPIAIWGLYELCVGDKKKWYIFVIGACCIIQSHIISIMFLLITCIVLGICYLKNIIKEKRYTQLVISLIFIILLNIWFIIPFINTYSEGNYVAKNNNGFALFVDHQVIPAQLFNIFDTGHSYVSNILSKDMVDEMNFSLGLLCSVGLMINIVYCYQNRNNKEKEIKFIKILTIMSIVFLIMTTTIFPWETFINKFELVKKIVNPIQFPWRLLGLSTLFISIASSMIIGQYVDLKYDNKKNFFENYKVVIAIGLLACIFVPAFLGDFSKQDKYINYGRPINYDMAGYGEYFIIGTEVKALETEKYNTSDRVYVVKHEKKGSDITLQYRNISEEKGYIELPLVYYPVYRATDQNGKKLEIQRGTNNVIRINIEGDKEGTIKVTANDSGFYRFLDIVSLITLVGFIILIVKLNKTNKKNKKSIKEKKTNEE